MGKTLTDFEIAGEDGMYRIAKAKIINKGTVVQVWNDEIQNPKNVRYGWQKLYRRFSF
ncbi:hypothetical protein [Flavicella sediminum]|uniref:hypothetical protein n=1 Tax=Flavicella sediminum TaxID=2585141 RepID=UPI00140AF284|nr:hypothetical protein [Flavicella sediminum]